MLYSLLAPPDSLPTVIAAWPYVPKHVWEAIVTLVEAALQSDSAKR